MKKFIIISLFLFVSMMNFTHAEAKTETCQIGAFRYKYKVEKQGVWIMKITPLSSKGIATLNIPSKLSGEKVVKLGASGDRVTDFDDFDRDTNLFGVMDPDEPRIDLLPPNIHKKVEKIKTIKIPSTVKILTYNCFNHIQDGKNINIPAGVTENVVSPFTRVKWNKIEVSAQNKKFKVKNGCLLSKNGTKLYGFVQKKKKIVIPSTVKKIVNWGDYNGCSTLVIPKSVNKIEKDACSTYKPMTVKVAKGNKRYAVKYGSVYSKVSGRLVLGYVKYGVLKIPEEVTLIDGHGFLGENLRKIIFPAGVKKIRNFFCLKPIHEGILTCVFYCQNPPELIEPLVWGNPIIYVPKNCKGKYMERWKELLEDPFVKVTFIELKS